ncbi:MAG: TonB family protein [Deltaproteobacteria bacterium]|nr:TonB family protein [Deltaproteobacteria bacterium]
MELELITKQAEPAPPPIEHKLRLAKSRKIPPKKVNSRAQLQPTAPLPPQLKMVELTTPQAKRPPDKAHYLSQRDRRVAQETRARRATLERPPKKKAAHKERRMRKVRHHPLLPMRQAKLATTPHGKLPDLRFRPKDHQRVFPRQNKRAREQARLDPSPRRKGRIARKWRPMRAALENFVPEVRPGNQTALNTRANPFAKYIARMHRRIHPLWGWGFLVDLDKKGDANPLNQMKLRVTMEIAVNPNGSLARVIIVRPSGELTFDVAALNTVFTAGPYPRTPKAIRSANKKVYLHWTFHRNHRQCGTFNVDPYILTTPPEGEVDGQNVTLAPRPMHNLRRLNRKTTTRRGWMRLAPRAPQRTGHLAHAAAAKLVSPADPAAKRLLHNFTRAFRRGDSKGMARHSSLPFRARGKVVARSRGELARMFNSLLQENPLRKVTKLWLTSVIGARQRLKRLPHGASHGAQMLVARARLGHTDVVLLLQRRNKRWHIVGLNR